MKNNFPIAFTDKIDRKKIIKSALRSFVFFVTLSLYRLSKNLKRLTVRKVTVVIPFYSSSW